MIKEILEQNEQVKYANKREIVDLLISASLNGDNDKIKETHVENIKRYFGR